MTSILSRSFLPLVPSLFFLAGSFLVFCSPAAYAQIESPQATTAEAPASHGSWTIPLSGTSGSAPYQIFWKTRIIDFTNGYDFTPDSPSCEGERESSCLGLLEALRHGDFDVVAPSAFSPDTSRLVEASPLYEVYSLCPQKNQLTLWQRDFGQAGINQLTRNFAVYDMTHSVERRNLDNSLLLAFRGEGFKQIDPQTKALLPTGYTDNGLFIFLASPSCQMAFDVIGVNTETAEVPASRPMIAEIVTLNGQPYTINGFIRVGNPATGQPEQVTLKVTYVSTSQKTMVSYSASNLVQPPKTP